MNKNPRIRLLTPTRCPRRRRPLQDRMAELDDVHACWVWAVSERSQPRPVFARDVHAMHASPRPGT